MGEGLQRAVAAARASRREPKVDAALVRQLFTALYNMRLLARPHFTDASQKFALDLADRALADATKALEGK